MADDDALESVLFGGELLDLRRERLRRRRNVAVVHDRFPRPRKKPCCIGERQPDAFAAVIDSEDPHESSVAHAI